jgi:hypothetical protein
MKIRPLSRAPIAIWFATGRDNYTPDSGRSAAGGPLSSA